ncbi:hypothetical protein POTOM_061269 [Populus tomentosa]|uniref:Glutaredoxin domain-containing protein n=1 Tax=Populus tomentosa TaxID=118781 RepID=A0A8X7XST0_POPTO|nr:hypothetical protein POTOM_061269 [Populus tomentosa]
MEKVTKLASERPVVIFSKSTCCMCHTIKTLFCDFGVNPAVHELDEVPGGREIEQALSRAGCPTLPAVFIGGEIVGGANEFGILKELVFHSMLSLQRPLSGALLQASPIAGNLLEA